MEETEDGGGGSLFWEQVVEDDTYLVRIEAETQLTLTMHREQWPEGEFYSLMTRVGSLSSGFATFPNRPLIHVNGHQVDHPLPRLGVPDGFHSEVYPVPGTHYFVLDSKGADTMFRIDGGEGSVEVLAVDPTIGTYRYHWDEDWEYDQWLYVAGRQIMEARTEIPLHHNFTLTNVIPRGDSWDLDFDPVCSFETEGHPVFDYSQRRWVVSNEPIDLTAKVESPKSTNLRFYTLDLPLPVPETGCWPHSEWKNDNPWS